MSSGKRLARTLRAEWTKLRSVPSTTWLLLAADRGLRPVAGDPFLMYGARKRPSLTPTSLAMRSFNRLFIRRINAWFLSRSTAMVRMR